MNRRTLTLGVISLLVTALVAAGCGGEENDENGAGSARTSAGVPFDRAFIDAMVPHHREAIAMAREAKKVGLGQPELVELADDIILTQQLEIDDMLAWREEWFGSRKLGPAPTPEAATGGSRLPSARATTLSFVLTSGSRLLA